MDAPSGSWSIYSRTEITNRYEILERVGYGAYSDVYRARRLSDSLIVALKEIHDYQSAFREIEALQILQNSPNIITLHEYFWREDEDAVLVLEFLRTDLASVIKEAKRNWEKGLSVGEIKRWMIQILLGIDACHRGSIVHRDLKPANLLISEDGVLKLADFGQSRILLEPSFGTGNNIPPEQNSPNHEWVLQQPEVLFDTENPEGTRNEEQETISKEDYLRELDHIKAKNPVDETDKETNIHDGDTSCLATCTASDIEDDPLKNSYTYEAEEHGQDESGDLTSCVGTRWFKAPELLYGSVDYGQEIDLWSLGCIFAELLMLEPLFPGTSDIDQLSRIINVLGNLTEETYPGCSKLPDYGKIFFNDKKNPSGLVACLPNRSPNEIHLVQKLVCYNPATRATAMELLEDSYFNEEPLPVPVNELRVPLTNSGQDESSQREWYNRDMDSDSDFEEFNGANVSTSEEHEYVKKIEVMGMTLTEMHSCHPDTVEWGKKFVQWLLSAGSRKYVEENPWIQRCSPP
ncbi:Protein kinase domain [Macleaya cordata]|uniref:cyclin-dependent kinase n=1 Tax=Macleaya cordata TaxID=56857 RepID=A0A200RC86_MACCD|nr:Protein kinase domain [Macleaya cordata]